MSGVKDVSALLWMRDDVLDYVGAADDLEIKPPLAIHASLPNLAALIVLLSMKGRMEEILLKKCELF